MRHIVPGMAAVILLAGCASPTLVTAGEPAVTPYAGPMHLPTVSDDPSVLKRSGAAGRALECTGTRYNGSDGNFDGSVSLAAADSAAEALEGFLEETELDGQLPAAGYRLEREDAGRALLSYDVADRTKVAFIAAQEGTGDGKGWRIESWAECDPAELPAEVTDDLGIEVWTDAAGRRVPVTKVRSSQGQEHCEWQDITFLTLGGAGTRTQQFLGGSPDAIAELEPDALRTTYEANAELPADATDTGLRHDGRELWLAPSGEAAYLVNQQDAGDVERWPAAEEPFGCR